MQVSAESAGWIDPLLSTNGENGIAISLPARHKVSVQKVRVVDEQSKMKKQTKTKTNNKSEAKKQTKNRVKPTTGAKN